MTVLSMQSDVSEQLSNPKLPLHIEHPSSRDCTTPDELCPRNEANEPVRVHGLSYYKDFLSPKEQEDLLKGIYDQPFQKLIARRQQFYGELYYHTSHKNKFLQPDDDEKETPRSLDLVAIQPHLEAKCKPFFGDAGFPSQVLVNEYRNNLGIASHFEDFGAFGPVILTLSLVNPIYMTLKKPLMRTNGCDEYHEIHKVLLEPGSLLVMEGDARFDYRHGISKYKWMRIPGREEPIHRGESFRRVSITVRHLLQTRRQVDEVEDESKGKKDADRY